MKKCPYCSTEILDEADFCLYCMHQLTSKTEIKKPIKKSRTGLMIGLIILSILLAIMLCCVGLFFAISVNNGFTKTQSTSTGYGDDFSISTQEEQTQGNKSNFFDFLFKKNEKDTEKSYDNIDNSSDLSENTTHTDSEIDIDDNILPGDNDNQPSSSSSKDEGSKGSSSALVSSEDSSEESVPLPQPVQIWETKEVSGGVEILGIATYNDSGNYSIPEKIDGKSVVGIGYRAFYYEQGLRSITLPNTLQYIGEQAFAYCNSITEIYIPSSVRKIENNAFLPCDKLSNIYIASTNINIANYAFSNSYQRSVNLTIHAPSSVMNGMNAKIYWDADYKEYNP